MKIIKLTKQADNWSLWFTLSGDNFAFESKTADPGSRVYYNNLIWDVVESPAEIMALVTG